MRTKMLVIVLLFLPLLALFGTPSLHNTAFAPRTVSAQAQQPPAAEEGEAEEDTNGSCETKSGPTGWFTCPIVLAIDAALNWTDTQIARLLEMDADMYDNERLKQSWGHIRNIAFIIIVPITLVMVISTALGFEFISAYTIKRALPRLVIAVIFITVSYQVCVFLIELIDAVGKGLLGIMTSPFAANGKTVSTLSLADMFEGGGPLTSIIAMPEFALFAVGLIIILWLFGGTLLLFIIVAFLVLLLRQIFITGLLLVAPLAILAWIFPGNDKLWKSWWSSFSKLLLMFPLIMAIIATGRIFAFIIWQRNASGLQGTIMDPIMIMAAYMLPYAAIPFTFKFAGGVFATVAGMANDKSKGLFDRQKKSRAAKLERTKNNNLFKGAPAGSRRARLNTIGAGVMNANKSGVSPFSRQSWRASNIRDNLRTAIDDRSIGEAAEHSEKNQDYTSWKGDDDLNRAAADSRDENNLREILIDRNYAGGDLTEINRAVKRVERVRKQMSASGFRQMTTLSAIAGGTAYDDAGQMAEAIARAGLGDAAATATLVAKGRAAAMQAGRIDQGGAGFGATLTAVQGLQQALATPGGINQDDIDAATERITGEAINSQGGMNLVGSHVKPSSIRNAVPILRERLDRAYEESQSQNNPEIYERELARVAGIYDAMASSSPQNAEILADGVLSYSPGLDQSQQLLPPGVAGPVAPGADRTTTTVRAHVENARANPAFVEMRREYQSAATAAAVAGQQPLPGQPGGPPAQGPPLPGQSDVRLKRDICYMFTNEDGVKVYSFRYLWSDQQYVGVMAQDLLETHSYAVLKDKNGYYMVDYSLLGMEMVTLETWKKINLVHDEEQGSFLERVK